MGGGMPGGTLVVGAVGGISGTGRGGRCLRRSCSSSSTSLRNVPTNAARCKGRKKCGTGSRCGFCARVTCVLASSRSKQQK